MSLFPSARDQAALEQRLRAGADVFGPWPPDELRGRILAEVRRSERTSARTPAPGIERWGSWIAAAAAAFVLCSAWWLTRRTEAPVERAGTVVALSKRLFDTGSLVLSLPGQAEDNLRLEAEKLLADTTRAAESVVRGLPGPLRARLEQL